MNSTLAVRNMINNNTLPGDIVGRGASAKPLCMHQYQRVFGVCRLPKPGRDALDVSHDSKHIAVILHGSIYAFDAVDRDGTPLSVPAVYAHLAAIKRHAESSSGDGTPNMCPLTCVVVKLLAAGSCWPECTQLASHAAVAIPDI